MAMAGRLRGLNKSCNLLIVINGMERFAFKGVASNLVSYLTDVVEMSNSAAAKTVNSWCGLTSIMPLLVVPLADSYCDTYSTIFAFSSLYALGLVALTSAALASVWSPQTNTSSRSVLFSSLCLISLAQGGYNPSLQAFGADQLETNDELPCSTTTKDDKYSRDKKSLFFQWWYYGVCTGSLLGVTVMSYIQDTFGWVLGFALPLLSMVFSILLFACGNRIYRFRADESYMHNKSFKGMVYSIKESVAKLSHTKSKTMELELEGKSLCNLNSRNSEGHEKIAEKGFYMNEENVKDVVRLLPIWITLLMFAVIFQLPATFFTKQGMTMQREIGNFKIPPATLQSAITISILILMPLYDKILIPSTRLLTRNEKGISVTQRMGIGMLLSIIAMIIAALVETRRLEKSKTESLSIFLLLPQYILLGISDIFTVVGMQEFFYGEVPAKMKRMGIALNTSVFGVGSFLSAGLISLVEYLTTSCSSLSADGGGGSWFADDLREARLDKYYWLLTLLSAFSFFFYVLFCKCFKSRNELVEDE